MMEMLCNASRHLLRRAIKVDNEFIYSCQILPDQAIWALRASQVSLAHARDAEIDAMTKYCDSQVLDTHDDVGIKQS